jgi:hypothetical protein
VQHLKNTSNASTVNTDSFELDSALVLMHKYDLVPSGQAGKYYSLCKYSEFKCIFYLCKIYINGSKMQKLTLDGNDGTGATDITVITFKL